MDLTFKSGATAQTSGSASGLIKDGGAATFVQDVIEASRTVPVIVDFWATWCGPCKQLGPALEKAVLAAKGAVRMVKIDVDREQELAAQLRIQSVPTVYAFKDGRPLDAFTGAIPDSQIKAFIGRLTAGAGSSPDDDVAEARQMLAEGDARAAADIFRQVLAQDPENAPALGGLLRCLLAVGETGQAEAMLARVPPEMAKHADIQAVRTALELARHAAGANSETAELRRRLHGNPDDHQARFDLAMAYYGGNEVEAAVDELLELYRRDRAWNEEAARKQLVKIFEVLGFVHPLAKSGRARLSAMMFS